MKPFFEATNGALIQITKLYDFIWPTALAMWNLRWQVKGFTNELGVNDVNEEDLEKRFIWGSKIHGVSVKKTCIQQTWEAQQEEFAKILLVNMISIFEGWIADIQMILQFNGDISKKIQYPTEYDSAGNLRSGILFGVQEICANPSTPLRDAFYLGLTAAPKYSLNHLDNLLKCYRFFKEARNCLAHHGGVADQKLLIAYQAFQPIATVADLGLAEVPIHSAPILGTPVRYDLRGAVGFSDVIRRIIITLDAELSTASQAIAYLLQRCQDGMAQHPRSNKLHDIQRPGEDRTKSLLSACGFPSTNNVNGVMQLLLQAGIIR